MTFSVDGKRLLTGEGATVEFAYDIGEVAVINDVFVVVLNVPLDASMTENVFGVSKKGEMIWQIERIPEISIDPTNSYTGVFPTLKLSKWSCHGVEIDVNTGKVVAKWFGK